MALDILETKWMGGLLAFKVISYLNGCEVIFINKKNIKNVLWNKKCAKFILKL